MNEEKNHTIRTVPKPNRKIIERHVIPLTHIYMTPHIMIFELNFIPTFIFFNLCPKWLVFNFLNILS